MSDISTARMGQARNHYPLNLRITKAIPYRKAIFTDSQIYRRIVNIFRPQYYEYSISATFNRLHCNAPIWTDYHSHDFGVTLVLRSPLKDGDLYAVDMIEAEKLLAQAIEQIPEKINDLPSCPNGTTEQMCCYFARSVKFCDRCIKIKSVSVSETPERVTIRRQKAEGRRQKFLLITYYLLPITYYLSFCERRPSVLLKG